MTEVICPECGEPMYTNPNEYGCMTLVAYFSPPGHDHDDNCLKKVAYCKNGHKKTVSIRRRCPNPNCDWAGKEECFCCNDKKIDKWPDPPEDI